MPRIRLEANASAPWRGKKCFQPKAIRLCPYRCKEYHWPYWNSLSWHSFQWRYICRSGTSPRTRPLGNTRYCLSHGCPTHFQENERNSPKYRTCNDRPKNRPYPVHNSRIHWCPPHKFFFGWQKPERNAHRKHCSMETHSRHCHQIAPYRSCWRNIPICHHRVLSAKSGSPYHKHFYQNWR